MMFLVPILVGFQDEQLTVVLSTLTKWHLCCNLLAGYIQGIHGFDVESLHEHRSADRGFVLKDRGYVPIEHLAVSLNGGCRVTNAGAISLVVPEDYQYYQGIFPKNGVFRYPEKYSHLIMAVGIKVGLSMYATWAQFECCGSDLFSIVNSSVSYTDFHVFPMPAGNLPNLSVS